MVQQWEWHPQELAAGWALDEQIMRYVRGWVYEPRFPGDTTGYWIAPDGTRYISEERPRFGEDRAAALELAEWVADHYKHGFINLQRHGTTWEADLSGTPRGVGIQEDFCLAICDSAIRHATIWREHEQWLDEAAQPPATGPEGEG